MSKLSQKAKSSKLNFNDTINEKKEPILRSTHYKEYPRSYRLDPEIMNTLKNTLYRINEISPKKVSESRLVKALILLSKDINEEKIIKALKSVW